MKKTNIIFWVFTALFAAFMLITAIPDVMLAPEAKVFMSHLGYPDYFTRFIGILKILGAIALVIPGSSRIKEWAYAGFFFDMIGATYSQLATDGFMPPIFFMLLPLGFCAVSYVYFHKRLGR